MAPVLGERRKKLIALKMFIIIINRYLSRAFLTLNAFIPHTGFTVVWKRLLRSSLWDGWHKERCLPLLLFLPHISSNNWLFQTHNITGASWLLTSVLESPRLSGITSKLRQGA